MDAEEKRKILIDLYHEEALLGYGTRSTLGVTGFILLSAYSLIASDLVFWLWLVYPVLFVIGELISAARRKSHGLVWLKRFCEAAPDSSKAYEIKIKAVSNAALVYLATLGLHGGLLLAFRNGLLEPSAGSVYAIFALAFCIILYGLISHIGRARTFEAAFFSPLLDGSLDSEPNKPKQEVMP